MRGARPDWKGEPASLILGFTPGHSTDLHNNWPASCEFDDQPLIWPQFDFAVDCMRRKLACVVKASLSFLLSRMTEPPTPGRLGGDRRCLRVAEHIPAAPYGLDMVIAACRLRELLAQLTDKDVD